MDVGVIVQTAKDENGAAFVSNLKLILYVISKLEEILYTPAYAIPDEAAEQRPLTWEISFKRIIITRDTISKAAL